MIAAVDTATARGSVALVEGGETLAELRVSGEGSHSTRLLPGLVYLLESLGRDAEAVRGYAVTVGPGSFTGLRVGIATVQGLALARGRPCLGVPTLDVLAARIRGSGDALVALMDAYRGELFAAVYDAEARPRGEPFLAAPHEVASRLPEGRVALIGDGARRHRELLERARPGLVFPDRSLYLAGTLGREAEPRLARGEGVSAAELRPLYVRAPAIRRPTAG